MLKPVFIHGTTQNDNPKFIKTETVTYTVGDKLGTKQRWERIKSHDSVNILVNKTDTKELLLVKRVRIPVLVNNPDTDASVIECCAGIIDKYKYLDKVPKRRAWTIAVDEVREELGYKLDPYHLMDLPQFFSSVGSSGSTCYPFYCEVTDDEKL